MGGRRKFKSITMRDVPRQVITPHDLVGDDDDETQPPSQPLDIMNDGTLVQETELRSDIGKTIETTSTRQGRGATKIHMQWNTGKKFEVEWNTANKVVTGKDSAALTSCVGILARNTFRFPLNRPSYTNLPKLDILWAEIQENTNLPMEAEYYVLKDFRNAWRAWKCKVKKMYFKPNRDNPDLLELCPPIMNVAQWNELTEYWLRDDIEKISERNARNQKLNLFPHRTGRTSFDVIINEMKAAGEGTSQMDVFKRSRKTPPNKPKNPNTDVVIEEMDKRVITALPEHEEMAKKQAWKDIQGPEKHGRVRCAPKGFAPSQLQSIGLPQSSELSEIPTSLLEKISEVVRKEFDENYRARVRAEMEEDFEALLQDMPRIEELDTFSMPPSENAYQD